MEVVFVFQGGVCSLTLLFLFSVSRCDSVAVQGEVMVTYKCRNVVNGIFYGDL